MGIQSSQQLSYFSGKAMKIKSNVDGRKPGLDLSKSVGTARRLVPESQRTANSDLENKLAE
jgi:hypothetical protein